MPDITFHPGRHHDFNPPRLDGLFTYAASPLPAPAATVVAPALTYPMACNNRLGDCTIADVVHSSQVWSFMTSERWTYCGDPATQAEYFKLTGGQDTGLVISQLLATWQAKGLGPVAKKIAAYAPVHFQNLTEVKQTVDWFGICRLGVNLPQSAMNQTNAGEPWAITGTAADSQILGGHDVPVVGYDDQYWYVVTWGRIQPVTYGWFQSPQYVEEAWGIIPSEFEARGGDGRGINIKQLTADVTTLNSALLVGTVGNQSAPAPHPWAGGGTIHQG
jgi:hypothetical protein